MSDRERYRSAPEPERRDAEAELIDAALRKIITAMVIAAALIALAIYWRPGPPRYQAVAAPDGRILRVDTRNGTILACDGDQCWTVVRHGQHLARNPGRAALPAPAAPVAPPAPAPAPAPAAR
ncbi:MAG TPA: hypothetical protein VK614_03155 [Allosphingosinicella sp.]|nr:hypothetical protein [Allosphingosinicella sp.]